MGKSLWVSVSLQQGKQLQELARKDHVSSSEIVRRAVCEYLGTNVFPSATSIDLNGQEVGPLPSKACHQHESGR